LPESPKAGQVGAYFASDSAGGAASTSGLNGSSAASGLHRLGSAAAALAAAEPDGMLPHAAGNGAHVLQRIVAERLGLLPTEEGKQMLHYVIPQVSTYTTMHGFKMLQHSCHQTQKAPENIDAMCASLELALCCFAHRLHHCPCTLATHCVHLALT
jgi:hypothetical protein